MKPRALAVAVLGTLAAGVWMRWSLAGRVALSLPFENLRHAHSHLGYFGMLFPLAWLGWKAAGVRTPGRGWMVFYAVSTAVATAGFVVGGYGPVAIAGSTAVSVVWLWSLGPLRTHMKRWRDPLGAVPLGLLLSLACVPPVAIHLRTDPDLAHAFVSTFLSGLLFVVVVPSVLAGARVSAGPWPGLLLTGALGALALGVSPTWPARLGLAGFAALLTAPVASKTLPLHTRASWLGVVVGIVALALGLLPNTRPVALGAVHFLILGPVMAVLAPRALQVDPPAWAWWLGHALWGSMSAALVAQAFVSGAWTWTAAALGGTGTLLWWAAAIFARRGVNPDGRVDLAHDERVDRQSSAPNPDYETPGSPPSRR